MRKLYSEEAEQSVLGAMLINPVCIDDVAEGLDQDAYHFSAHQEIHAAIIDLRQQNCPVDVLTLAEHYPNLDSAYLVDLFRNTPSAANVLEYVRFVIERKMERDLFDCAVKIQTLVMDPELDTDVRIGQAQALFTALVSEKQPSTRIEIKDSLKHLLEVIDQRFEGNDSLNQIRTGLADVDKRIMGYRGGNLILVGARPGMGKTTFGMAVVRHAAQHYGNTLVFSLEMPHVELTSRLVASCGRAQMRHIRDPQSADDSFWPKLSTGTQIIKDLPLVIDDQGALSITQLASRARREHRKCPVKLIMIDYIQLMEGSKRRGGDNRNLEIGEVSRGLKSLAKELDCPIVALSQLSRSVENRPNKRPLNSDLRESGSLEQDADIIHFLYRDEVYDENTTDKGIMEVITTKFRDGEVGTDRLIFEGRYNLLADLDHERFANQQAAHQPKKTFSYGAGGGS